MDVQIRTVDCLVVAINRITGQFFFNVVKFIRQLGINHVVVKAAKCFNKDVSILRLNVIELFFEFVFGVHGTNFLEFFSKVLHGCI